ncbi:MAG: hypothetical protein ABFQ82_06065 [Thermodesulfobacteriota bacterium]
MREANDTFPRQSRDIERKKDMPTEDNHPTENSNPQEIIQPNWAATVLPPLMIVCLIFIPFDMVTMFFWGPAFIAAIVSLFRLALALFKLTTRKEQLNRKSIRQALTIAFYLVALQITGMSADSAEDFATRTARAVQTACNSADVCPGEPDGFNCPEPGSCKARYGEYGAKYFVFFSLEENGRSFLIRHRRSIDDWTVITGGINRELTFKRMMDDQVIENKKLN